MHTPAERDERSAARNGRSGLYGTDGETAVTVVTGDTDPDQVAARRSTRTSASLKSSPRTLRVFASTGTSKWISRR